MLEINELNFKYENGTEFALKDINVVIEPGDFVGIIGPAAAGKSTLISALNGVVPHHYSGDFYGSVKVCGLDTVENGFENLAVNVGTVFQDIDAQLTASIVEDELLFGLENFAVPHEEIESRITDSLEMLGLSELRYRDISTLSGGQKQKVAICAMLALRPKILLLDEPTGELDPRSSRQIFEILRELNQKYGMTIVIVEQKIMLLCEFVDKLAVMERGKMKFFGKVHEVLTHSDELEQMGVNIPRIVTLARKLKEMHLYQGAFPLSLDEAEKMVREISGEV